MILSTANAVLLWMVGIVNNELATIWKEGSVLAFAKPQKVYILKGSDDGV
jgi:hypothetical protein